MTERIQPSPILIRLRDVYHKVRKLEEIRRHEGTTESEDQELTSRYRERNEIILDAIINGGADDIDLKVDVDLIKQTFVVLTILSGRPIEIRTLEDTLRRPGVIDTKEQLLERLGQTNQLSSQ